LKRARPLPQLRQAPGSSKQFLFTRYAGVFDDVGIAFENSDEALTQIGDDLLRLPPEAASQPKQLPSSI
jgi:hypothetical protein